MGLDDITTSRLGCARPFAVAAMARSVDTALDYLLTTPCEFRKELLTSHEMPENEAGLTDALTVGLNGSRRPLGLIFKAESRENRFRGDSPAVDIGILWELPGQGFSSWPRISTIEAKRLDSTIDFRRRREYVYGHDEKGRHVASGGIERYKKSIHGQDISTKFMLLAYMQTDDFATWHDRINGWIEELVAEKGHEPPWSEGEKLTIPLANDGLARCESTTLRMEDSLSLVHVWVDLTGKCKDGGHA